MPPREDYYLPLPRDSTLASLPPEYPLAAAQDQISELLSSSSSSSSTSSSANNNNNNNNVNKLIILDDDPTGTQTCHDIAVLTVWDVPTLVSELRKPSPESRGFFILTNSRALPPVEAERLLRSICENVAEAARATGQQVDIVLRGDSTLRGHFPLEVDVAQEVLFGDDEHGVDAWVLAPFFLQGGRFTIDDVHYVAEGNQLVPAGQTQFARDATFGYRSSNLRDYIAEKAPGRFEPEQICSISIEDVRVGGPERVREKLISLPKGAIVVVNAAAESDMAVFVAGLLQGIYIYIYIYTYMIHEIVHGCTPYMYSIY